MIQQPEPCLQVGGALGTALFRWMELSCHNRPAPPGVQWPTVFRYVHDIGEADGLSAAAVVVVAAVSARNGKEFVTAEAPARQLHERGHLRATRAESQPRLATFLEHHARTTRASVHTFRPAPPSFPSSSARRHRLVGRRRARPQLPLRRLLPRLGRPLLGRLQQRDDIGRALHPGHCSLTPGSVNKQGLVARLVSKRQPCRVCGSTLPAARC